MNSNHLLFLLRAWLPSWKFFEESGETLALFVRWGNSEHSLSDWAHAFAPLERKWYSLFINPEVNFRHLNETLLQQLKDESEQFLQGQDMLEFENLSSFRIVKDLALEQIQRMESARGMQVFQFKISGLSPHQHLTNTTDDVIISRVYDWRPE